jgi:cytochrome c oxidase cbb3-type subunit III
MSRDSSTVVDRLGSAISYPVKMKRPMRAKLLAYICLVFSLAAYGQEPAVKKSTATPGEQGRKIFSTSCASCHGLDGRGGERGPDISRRRAVRQLSDKALVRIVSEGVPGTGMPAFHLLGSTAIHAVVRHLRSLQGQSRAAALPGNPRNGETMFFGKAECSQCHMAKGKGGFIASDLTNYAGSLAVAEVRAAIVDPNRNIAPDKRALIVTAEDGTIHTGVVRNEDNFTLQLQTPDGAFHFFNKSEVKNIERKPGSLMPPDYGTRFSSQELNDLVSYLMDLGRRNGERPTEKRP